MHSALGWPLQSSVLQPKGRSKKQGLGRKKWDHNLESFEEMVGSVDGRLCLI